MIFQHDNYHLPIQEIVMREAEAKQKIARKAYQFIGDNDVILLDDSTTVQELARLLAAGEQSDLTVVTGSLAVANLLRWGRWRRECSRTFLLIKRLSELTVFIQRWVTVPVIFRK